MLVRPLPMRPNLSCIDTCIADELDVLRQRAFWRTPIFIMLFAVVQQIVTVGQIALNLIHRIALIRDGHVVALPDMVVFDKTVLRLAPEFNAVTVSRRVIQHAAADVADGAPPNLDDQPEYGFFGQGSDGRQGRREA